MLEVYRVHSWPDGVHYVDVATSRDGMSCDALVAAYKEEGSYEDAGEAALAAIRLRENWARDTDWPVFMRFDGEVHASEPDHSDNDGMDADEMIEAARKYTDNLPKCDRCGEPLTSRPYVNYMLDGEAFCSAYCADTYLAEVEAELELDRGEEY